MSPADRRQSFAARKADWFTMFRIRAGVVAALFVLAFIGVQVRILSLGFAATMQEPEIAQLRQEDAPRRGNIYDRNGVLLATSLEIMSLYADPKEVMDVKEVVYKLSKVLPELDASDIQTQLKRPGRFVWLKRRLTPEQVYRVNALGLPGLDFRKEYVRAYPQRELMAHIVGGVDPDQRGLAGVERTANNQLASGQDIYLTVDVRLQQMLRQSLFDQMLATHSKGASGVVLDPKTADILAAVSLPDFDANHYGKASADQWKNFFAQQLYEAGSTFKVFTYAQALEENLINLNTRFDISKPLMIGGYKISDYKPHIGSLSAAEIMAVSSNIGTAKIADLFPEGSQRQFLNKLNMMSQLNTGFGAEAMPLYPQSHQWKRLATMSVSFGHTLAVSPMHVVAGYSALVSDGYWREPKIIRNMLRPAPRRVVSERTVGLMRELMLMTAEDGTGKLARVPGYQVGGKTGTAEKNTVGGYDKKKNIASFIGSAPLNDPRLVTLVLFDEPNQAFNTGGMIAAPAFQRFTAQALPLLGVMPQTTGQDVLAEKVQFRQASLMQPAAQ